MYATVCGCIMIINKWHLSVHLISLFFSISKLVLIELLSQFKFIFMFSINTIKNDICLRVRREKNEQQLNTSAFFQIMFENVNTILRFAYIQSNQKKLSFKFFKVMANCVVIDSWNWCLFTSKLRSNRDESTSEQKNFSDHVDNHHNKQCVRVHTHTHTHTQPRTISITSSTCVCVIFISWNWSFNLLVRVSSITILRNEHSLNMIWSTHCVISLSILCLFWLPALHYTHQYIC